MDPKQMGANSYIPLVKFPSLYRGYISFLFFSNWPTLCDSQVSIIAHLLYTINSLRRQLNVFLTYNSLFIIAVYFNTFLPALAVKTNSQETFFHLNSFY